MSERETMIYSRAHRVCQACGATLPSELLLTEAQLRYHEEKSERKRKAEREADLNVDTRMPDVPPGL
jgi:transcription initiation factor TFIIIB Brf1 subunit/transcription initiation factor TFIIB